MKPKNAGYRPGDHWAICDRCGAAYRQSNLRPEWNGLIVCKYCWEPRHAQDFVRGREDNQAAKGNVRPESPNVFLETAFGKRSAIAGVAIAGLAVAGVDANPNIETTIPSGTFDMSLD